MTSASKLLMKFSQKLFADLDQRAQFIQALTQPQSFHPCILWCQDRPDQLPWTTETPLPWQPKFVDRLSLQAQPGRHPLHDQGAYYCLDNASIFAALTTLATPQQPTLVIDVCASPGGKSLFAWQGLHPHLLLSNEVIGKRVGRLVGNLKRCQIDPVMVCSLDPSVLAQALPQTAGLVIVDAPCSGQSLLAKGSKAPGCFHPVQINRNANRQKRILANAAQLVAPEGYLAYMTCTFSEAENEGVSTWFLGKFPQFQPQVVPQLTDYQSHLSDLPSYRIWPQSQLGAGAFSILMQNTEPGDVNTLNKDALRRLGCRWQSAQAIAGYH